MQLLTNLCVALVVFVLFLVFLAMPKAFLFFGLWIMFIVGVKRLQYRFIFGMRTRKTSIFSSYAKPKRSKLRRIIHILTK